LLVSDFRFPFPISGFRFPAWRFQFFQFSILNFQLACDRVETVRLDIWPDIACLFKTRSEAQKACKLGQVSVNGVAAKPHRDVRPGDEMVISRPGGRKQLITVRGLADRHISKTEARELYEDRTPPPTPEEVEMRRIERLFRATTKTAKKPDRRKRQDLRRMRGKD
jgi:ribosome-associated heat shock protein Hsp15